MDRLLVTPSWGAGTETGRGRGALSDFLDASHDDVEVLWVIPLKAGLTGSLERCEGCNKESLSVEEVFVRQVQLAWKMVMQSNNPLFVRRVWEEKMAVSQVQVAPTCPHDHLSLVMI
jgi:hypothetical protein